MNLSQLITKIKIKFKEHQYVKYIDNHKFNIDLAFEEMIMCPDTSWMSWNEQFCYELKQRVNKHDDSKFDYAEFEGYRRNFYPINEQEKNSAKKMYESALGHHLTNNRHHWQARQDDPDYMTNEIMLDCIENVLDWMAMGYQFKNRPYQYYEQHKDEIKLPKCQIDFIERLIYEGIDKKYIKKENID